ncbi:NUDIX hydrolase [Marivirga harenae]|uniref:NUDIX hydrolase n=1 Tax=Marivirga harenae TaxID=2010992 RepID=UPI0026E0475D|nr:NUDIX hydrolase [Marivirga harenae]WKV10779.1 NUDIX hydrolase [Marivirga harenae]
MQDLLLMQILKQYNPNTEEERDYKYKMLQLFESKKEVAFTRQNIQAHFTASAWIIDSISRNILLLHHKKLNKWLQPGGHADGEIDLEQVSRKEAFEETGLKNLALAKHGIFDIDIHEIPEFKGVPQHYHYDVRFAYFCNHEEKTKINSESNSFQWIEIGKVKDLTNEPSIIRMVNKTRTLLNEL